MTEHQHAWDPPEGVCECGFGDGDDPFDGGYDPETGRWIFADGWSPKPPHWGNAVPSGRLETE